MAISWILVFLSMNLVAGEPLRNGNFRNAKIQLNTRHSISPIQANNRGQMMSARDIAAHTLVEEYNSQNSVVTKQQELGILDLSKQLSGPGFSHLETDIISASSVIASKTNSQSNELPPEDEDDYDLDEEESIEKDGEANESESVSDLMKSDVPEKSLVSVSSRIISMGKGLLKALRVLTGVVSGTLSGPIRKTVSSVLRDRRISVCSKMSLDTLIREKEKLDLKIKDDEGCDINTALKYNLSKLHIAVSLLKCYVKASTDKRKYSGELVIFNSQITQILMQIVSIQRLSKLNQYTQDQTEIFNQFLDLQDKLEALSFNVLVMQLSDSDVSFQTYNLALFSLMRNVSSLLQVSSETDFKGNKDFHEVYCQTNDMMIDEFRRLGTTTVDRLIRTARTVVNSFDNFATKSINILEKVNTYKEMYDQIFMTAKALQDGMNAYKI